MKVAGICHICGKPAFSNCLLCGQATCKDHMDEKGFACRKCVPGKMDGKDKKNRASDGPGDPGGVMG